MKKKLHNKAQFGGMFNGMFDFLNPYQEQNTQWKNFWNNGDYFTDRGTSITGSPDPRDILKNTVNTNNSVANRYVANKKELEKPYFDGKWGDDAHNYYYKNYLNSGSNPFSDAEFDSYSEIEKRIGNDPNMPSVGYQKWKQGRDAYANAAGKLYDADQQRIKTAKAAQPGLNKEMGNALVNTGMGIFNGLNYLGSYKPPDSLNKGMSSGDKGISYAQLGANIDNSKANYRKALEEDMSKQGYNANSPYLESPYIKVKNTDTISTKGMADGFNLLAIGVNNGKTPSELKFVNNNSGEVNFPGASSVIELPQAGSVNNARKMNDMSGKNPEDIPNINKFVEKESKSINAEKSLNMRIAKNGQLIELLSNSRSNNHIPLFQKGDVVTSQQRTQSRLNGNDTQYSTINAENGHIGYQANNVGGDVTNTTNPSKTIYSVLLKNGFMNMSEEEFNSLSPEDQDNMFQNAAKIINSGHNKWMAANRNNIISTETTPLDATISKIQKEAIKIPESNIPPKRPITRKKTNSIPNSKPTNNMNNSRIYPNETRQIITGNARNIYHRQFGGDSNIQMNNLYDANLKSAYQVLTREGVFNGSEDRFMNLPPEELNALLNISDQIVKETQSSVNKRQMGGYGPQESYQDPRGTMPMQQMQQMQQPQMQQQQMAQQGGGGQDEQLQQLQMIYQILEENQQVDMSFEEFIQLPEEDLQQYLEIAQQLIQEGSNGQEDPSQQQQMSPDQQAALAMQYGGFYSPERYRYIPKYQTEGNVSEGNPMYYRNNVPEESSYFQDPLEDPSNNQYIAELPNNNQSTFVANLNVEPDKVYTSKGDPYLYKQDTNGIWHTRKRNSNKWISLENNKDAINILDNRSYNGDLYRAKNKSRKYVQTNSTSDYFDDVESGKTYAQLFNENPEMEKNAKAVKKSSPVTSFFTAPITNKVYPFNSQGFYDMSIDNTTAGLEALSYMLPAGAIGTKIGKYALKAPIVQNLIKRSLPKVINKAGSSNNINKARKITEKMRESEFLKRFQKRGYFDI